MNVNLNSISLQQRKFSGTNSIGGIHLPDFNDKYVFSKKKSNTSNVEYKKQIAEQAYEDFKNGQFQNKSEGFNKLMKKYTSEVSPDRKGIITSGLKAVSRNKQSGLKPIRDFALKNKNPCSACEFQAKQGISIWGIKLLFFSV